jgi:hypothetical protein
MKAQQRFTSNLIVDCHLSTYFLFSLSDTLRKEVSLCHISLLFQTENAQQHQNKPPFFKNRQKTGQPESASGRGGLV